MRSEIHNFLDRHKASGRSPRTARSDRQRLDDFRRFAWLHKVSGFRSMQLRLIESCQEDLMEPSLSRESHSASLSTLRPYPLHHTFAAHLLQGGADLRRVQSSPGYDSPDTTARYLGLVRDDHNRFYNLAVWLIAPQALSKIRIQ